MYPARPDFLAYHNLEYHVMDINVSIICFSDKLTFTYILKTSCSEISFGSVDEILSVPSEFQFPQPIAQIVTESEALQKDHDILQVIKSHLIRKTSIIFDKGSCG